jgi:hypothetical protein
MLESLLSGTSYSVITPVFELHAQFTGICLGELQNTNTSITVENRSLVERNSFDHKDIGNHLLK